MIKLNKLAILIPLLFGLNAAEAGYQLRMYSPGIVAPTCSDPWGGSLNIGQSVTAYRVGAVSYDQSCQSESRSCQNGALTGSYTFQTCAVQTAQDCNLQGYVVTHNHGVFAYSAPTVAYNSSCDAVKETRTCTNGNLSGSFTHTTCSVTPELSCTFNGNTVTSEAPVVAYSSSTVPFGSSCSSVQETRACTNGVLSGSFTNPNCSVLSSCTAPKTVLAGTGSVQTVTVPTGCTTATVKAWGAGGGATTQTTTGYGGGGGYAQRNLTVSPGSVLYAYVGTAGSVTSAGLPGGGAGSRTEVGYYAGSHGGGFSGLFNASPYSLAGALVVAGGGGGAGGTPYETNSVNGGPAGSAASDNAVIRVYGAYTVYAKGGQPGTQSAGGQGGGTYGVNGGDGTHVGGSGSAFQGGAANSSIIGRSGGGGGGGGGGYYGGGAGGSVSTDTTHYPNNLGGWGGGGGGGGSSYAPGGTTLPGNMGSAANTTDSDYVANTGNGGYANHNAGQPGALVIIWSQ